MINFIFFKTFFNVNFIMSYIHVILIFSLLQSAWNKSTINILFVEKIFTYSLYILFSSHKFLTVNDPSINYYIIF
jgi:hypothetical protein